MNALCYKTVFSKRLGALVAVGEHATSQSKGQGAGAASGTWDLGSVLRYVGMLTLGFAAVSLAWSQTLPQGGRVSQGQVTISQSGQQMAIHQSTAKAVVNWDSFDIGVNAKVNIAQPSSQSVLLNRVLSDNPTQILGQLQANGQVVLVNPKGIVVGSDGSVSASAFTASTLNISDADFMAGNGRYSREGSTGEVVNKGRINVAPGGYVALLGARVSNEGTIIAPQGAVALGAAETVTVPIGRTGKIKLELTPASINASVANQKNGVIVAEGGQVYMQAAALGQAVASVLHSGHIDTSGAQAGAVHVLADGGQIKVDGRITANSSGHDDQGQLRKGGDIFIGRDEDTGVLARKTDASGAQLESQRGFVETSGDHLVTTGTRVKAAEWLLDPTNITIAASGPSGTAYASTYTAGVDSVILASDINANLNAGTGVTIATSSSGASAGNINVNASIAKTSGSFASLTLRAHNDIVVAANTTITSTSGNLNVTLNSDFDANGAGAIVMNTGSGITSNGGNISLGGGSAGSADSYATGNSTNPNGVLLDGASLLSNGGNITLRGKSTSGSTLYDFRSNGIRLRDASGNNVINAGSGQIAMYGLSASTGSDGAYGIEISQYGTPTYSTQLISSNSSSAILLDGTGSTASTALYRIGVYINAKGTVSATGNGGVTIIAANGGGSGEALALLNGSSINTSTANAPVTVSADSVYIDPTSTGSINAGTGTVTLQNRTAGTLINVGGADVLTGTPLTLGVSNAELNRITAGTLKIGSTTSGAMTTSAAVTTAASTGNVYLQSGNTLTASTAITSGAGLLLQTAGGAISTTAALSGTNVSVDNTNGTITWATGALTAGASSGSATNAVNVASSITATGNVNILGNVGTTTNTGVNVTSAGSITSSGTAATVNITSNGNVVNAAPIKVTGTTGTGANINLTSTSGTITGAGAIGDTTHKNASVTYTQSGTSTYSGAINAANFTKAGTGALTLNSWMTTNPDGSKLTNVSNAYTVSSGSLALDSNLSSYPTYAPASVNVVNAATFSLSANGNGRWNNTAFNFTGASGGGTMNLGGNPIGASGTTNTFSTSGGATNTIVGGFNGNSANININLASATSGTTLLDGSFAALTFSQNALNGFGLSNTATVNVSGGGHLLIRDRVAATTFNINAGNVQVGDGSAATAAATATLEATNVSIASGSKLTFNRAEAYTNASAITGAGSLVQAGAGVVTLTGNSSAFAGATTVNAGRTLAIGTGGSLGAAASTLTLTSSTSNLSFTNTSGTSTVASTISGTGTVTQNGAGGTGLLLGNNTYSGATTITAGTLQVGNGGTTGTLGTGSVTDNSALVFNRSDNITVSNAISGTGTVTQAGTGVLTFPQVGTGTVNNTYTGQTFVNAGTLSLKATSNSAQYGTNQFNIASGATLNFDVSTGINTGAYTNTTFAGNGTITKTGAGQVVWNTTAATFNLGAGSLIDVQAGNFVGSSNTNETWTNNLSSLNVAAGATFAGSEGNIRVDALTGAGTVSTGWSTSGSITVGVNGTAAGTYNPTAGTATFSGVISSTTANTTVTSLSKIGAGTQILTGTNTYQGVTTISAGTLQIGSGGTTGTLGTGAVTNNASLVFNRSNAMTVANAISGTGAVSQTGAGTTTLTADNTYAGTTSISGGTLQVGNAGTTGTLGAGDVTMSNNANLSYVLAEATTIANNISGAGNVSASITGAASDLTVNRTIALTSGTVNLMADRNLSVTQAVSTTNSTSSAVMLVAGKTSSAGTATGGDVTISGSGAVTAGTNGRVTFMTGSVAGSTGLGVTAGNNRYNSDEVDTNYTTALGSGAHTIYREKPLVTVQVNNASKTYDGLGFTGGSLNTTLTSGALLNGDTIAALTANAGFDGAAQGAKNASTTPYAITASDTGGKNALGYGLTYSAGSLTINKANLMQITAAKTYDGSSTVTAAQMTTIQGVNGETFTASAGTASISDKNVAYANNTLTNISGLTLNGVSGSLTSNYNLESSSLPAAGVNNAVSITKANLTLVTAAKTYDGLSTVTAEQITSIAGINGETFNATAGAAAISDKNVTTAGKTLTDLSGLTLTGVTSLAISSNYNLSSNLPAAGANNAVSITTKTLTPTITASDKTYDQSNSATITNQSISGVISGDTVSLSAGSSSIFASANVARNTSGNVTSQTVTATGLSLSGADASNYALTSTTATTSATINPKSVTVAITASDKTYDQTATATVNRTTSDLYSSDAADVTIGSTSNTFASADVARSSGVVTSQTVTSLGLSLTGAKAGNYALTNATATTTATISPKSLTATVTASDKTYDQSNAATITSRTSADIIAGDAVTLSSAGANFASANVARNGSGSVISQTVTASGLTLAGAQAGNYTLTNATATTTATINPKTVSLTATKTYDGSTALTGSQLVLGDLLPGEMLSFAGATLNDKNVTGAAYVNAVTLVNSGTTLASNYQAPVLTAASTGNTASVTPAALAANLTGTVSKVYDATTNATLGAGNFNVTGWVSTEGASVTQTAGTYASANVDVNGGSGAVSATLASSHFTANSGTLLSNYTLPTSASGNVGTITPAALTVKVGDTKAFVTQDANTAANTGVSYVGFKELDNASTALVTVPTAANRTYTGTSITPTVGNYSTVYGLDFIPTSQHGNYTVTVQKGNLEVVAADKLIVTVASQTDTYGNRNASTSGQASNVTAQYCFVATNCNGTNLYNIAMVAGSGSQWSGTDNTGTTVSMTTTVATSSNLSVGGYLKAGNYNWDVANLSATAATPYNGYVVNSGTLAVDKLAITPTASNVSKVYDGTTSAAGVTLNTLQAKSGDTVSALAGSGTYTTKSVVSNDAVTFGSLTLSGADKDNYALAVSSVHGTGSITPANLTVTATAVTKTYDGTTSTTALGLVGTLAGSGDSVNSPGSQSYTNKNAGTGKTVQASGVTIKDGSGADMTGNYTITYVDNTTSVINQANLTVTATQVAKTYDGTTTAPGAGAVGTLAGAAANESVNSAGTQAFTDKNFGLSNKTVTASGVTIKDNNNADVTGNYIIAYLDNTTSTINKADLTVTAQAVTKVYDGTTTALGNGSVGTLAGAAANESVNSAGTQAFLDKNAGAGNKTVQASGVTIKDASNADVTGNYNLTYVNNTASTITPAALTASLTGTVSKVYDASTNATLSAGNFNVTGWVSGEGASVTQTTGTYASANVNANSGTGAVSASLASGEFAANSGTLLSNYTLPTSASGNVGTITPAALSVNVNNTKAFVTQNASTAMDTGVSYTGLQGADTAATALVQVPVAANRTYTGTGTPAVGNYSAVYGLDFTPAGQNGNYTVTVQKGNLEVVPADRILITVGSQTDTYGNRTASTAGQASSVTAQYCFSATDCNSANLYSLAMTAGTGNTWTALDNAGATVSMETTVTTAGNLSSSGHLKAGNYTYGVTSVASSPTTQYSAVAINGGTLAVNKLDITPTATTVSKVYDGSTSVAGVTLNLAAVKSGDAVTGSATTGTYTTKNVIANDSVTFGGLSLSGVDKDNYALTATSVQTSGAITPRALTLQAASNSKTYDGSTSSSGTVTVSGLAASSSDSVTSLTQAFASKNVMGANGSTLNVNSGYTVNDGNSGNNYTVSTQSANGTITPKSLRLAAVTSSKTYDGTTTSTANVAVTGIADNSGDTVTSLSQAFGTKNVLGTDGSTLSVNSGYTVNDGNLGQNYTVATSTAAGTITPKALTLAATTDTKTYDGTTSSLASVVVSGIASGSGDTVSGQSQSFGSKNVLGTGGSTLSVNSGYTVNDGNSGQNYSVSTTTAAGTITAKALVLTAISDSKVYDGNTTSSGAVAISGLAAGSTDSVTAVQSFGSKNVLGTNGSTLSVNSGYTVSDGNAGNNYTVTTQSANGSITSKALTLAAVTDTKTYDGTTSSSVNVAVSGIAANSGDTVTGLSQAFGSKNVLGTNGSTLTVAAGYTVNDGNSGRNYSVGTTGATGTINKADLTVTATSVTKTYDATVNAAGHGTVGSLAGVGDSVNSQGAQAFLDANAGTGKTVRASGVTIKDASSLDMTANYNILYADNTASVINKANLTITANTDARFVTQNDPAGFNGVNYSGWVGGESEAVLGGTLAIARTDASINVAAGSYPGSLVPSGLASDNYTIRYANGNYTIVPANQLLIRTTNMSTTYGTTPTYSTTAQYLDGANVINTLSRSVSGNTMAFSDNAGGSVTVNLQAFSGNTPAGVSSSGNTVVGNYLIEDKSPLITGANFVGAPVFVGNLAVNQKSVTPTVSGLTKVYDGTTAAANAALSLTGQVTGDTLVISGSGVFNSKNAGTQLGYAFNNLALSGADQGNYFFSGGNSLTGSNGTITPATLRLTTTHVTKTYDGTLGAAGTATVTGGTQLFGQDSISGGTFAFTNKNAGTGNKTVTTSAVTITDGNNGGNYAVIYVDNTTSTINPAALTVTAAAAQKTYDGTLSASGTGVVGALAGAGDSVASAGSLSFTDKNAGNGKTVTVAGVQIKDSSGADMTGNYAISYASSTSGVITPANATISESSKTVTYNGATQTQDAPTLSGFVTGDNVQASGAASGRNAGTYFSDLVATGTDVANYNITYVNAPLVINKLGASMTATGTSVIYNGQTQTQGAATLTGFIAGDDVAATGLASGRNAGTYNSGLAATGADAGNYNITFNNAALTIARRPASLSALGQTVVYNGQTQSLNGSQGSGFIAGDALSFGGLPSGRHVGQYTSAMTVTGADAANYDITLGNATLIITPKSSSVTARPERVTYNGQTQLQSSALLEGFIAGDDIRVSGLASGRNAGVYGSNVLATGQDAGNYSITYQQGALTIDKAPLQIVGTSAADKQYDGNIQASVTPGRITGLVGNESLSVLSLTGQFDTAEPGNNKPVTVVYGLGDGQNGGLVANYDWSPVTVTANIRREAPFSLPAPQVSRPAGPYSRLSYMGFGGLTGMGAATGQVHYAMRNQAEQQCSPRKLEECICERPQEGAMEICYPQKADLLNTSRTGSDAGR